MQYSRKHHLRSERLTERFRLATEQATHVLLTLIGDVRHILGTHRIGKQALSTRNLYLRPHCSSLIQALQMSNRIHRGSVWWLDDNRRTTDCIRNTLPVDRRTLKACCYLLKWLVLGKMILSILALAEIGWFGLYDSREGNVAVLMARRNQVDLVCESFPQSLWCARIAGQSWPYFMLVDAQVSDNRRKHPGDCIFWNGQTMDW